MPAEGNLKKQVDALLRQLHMVDKFPIWYLKILGSPWQRGGVPDYLISVNGRLLALELKAPNGITSKRQLVEQGWLKDSGTHVATAKSFGEAVWLIYVHSLMAIPKGDQGVAIAQAGLNRLRGIKERLEGKT